MQSVNWRSMYHISDRVVEVQLRDLGGRISPASMDFIYSQVDLISACISTFYQRNAINESVEMATISTFTNNLEALQPLNIILRQFNVEILYASICQVAGERDTVHLGLMPLLQKK